MLQMLKAFSRAMPKFLLSQDVKSLAMPDK
jgi:hypothetical protein